MTEPTHREIDDRLRTLEIKFEVHQAEKLRLLEDVKESMQDMQNRQGGFFQNYDAIREGLIRLEETFKAINKSHDLHSQAIEELLKRTDKLESQFDVSDTQKKTLVSLTNNGFLLWVLGILSAGGGVLLAKVLGL